MPAVDTPLQSPARKANWQQRDHADDLLIAWARARLRSLPEAEVREYGLERALAVADVPWRSQPEIEVTVHIRKCDLPALRSAIEEISNEVGGRLEGPHTFPKEAALTSAVIALGRLRAALSPITPPDREY